MAKNDGGPAYPRAAYDMGGGDRHPEQDGMTMRQAYKLAALQGMLQKFDSDIQCPEHHDGNKSQASILAHYAGQYADAMIAEDQEFEARTHEQ